MAMQTNHPVGEYSAYVSSLAKLARVCNLPPSYANAEVNKVLAASKETILRNIVETSLPK